MQASTPTSPNSIRTESALNSAGRGSPGGPPSSPTQSRKRAAHRTPTFRAGSGQPASDNEPNKKRSATNGSAPVRFEMLAPNGISPPRPGPFPTPNSANLPTVPKVEQTSPNRRALATNSPTKLPRLNLFTYLDSITTQSTLLVEHCAALQAALDEADEQREIATQVLDQVIDDERENKGNLNKRINQLDGKVAALEAELREAESTNRAKVAGLEEEVRVTRGKAERAMEDRSKLMRELKEMMGRYEGK